MIHGFGKIFMELEKKEKNKIKVFVSVGTHKKPFNRLIKAVDELKTENFVFFAQTGFSDFKPKNIQFKAFLSEKEFKEKINEADIVLSHAGAGIIITALALNKKLVLMPRQKKFNEHSNDHQLELALKLSLQGKAIMVLDEKDLSEALIKALELKAQLNSNKANLIEVIKNYIKVI